MRFLLLLMVCFGGAIDASCAVTYELSPGRFGDNLLSYIHAKWISYTYDIPLLYKPFIYSDKLRLHYQEKRYSESEKQSFSKTVVLGKHIMPSEDESSVLYYVPYFPESKWELSECVNFQGKPWDYFEINWNDVGFIAELRKDIAPINEMPRMTFPADRIPVAVHVRRGGNYDTPDVCKLFAWKFLPDKFFISQLKELYRLLDNCPLYVYFFTDDLNPEHIVATFKQALKDCNITFDYRSQGNCDTANVVEDFFALQQFDCLIHSESNFSFIMSKLGDYKISIYPDSFYCKNGKIVHNHVSVLINNVT